MEVSNIEGKVQVRLKTDSKDEGFIWEDFLRKDVDLEEIVKQSNEYMNHRENILPITTERKKYLLEQILEPYYAENDPAKIEFFGLNTQEEYDELKKKLADSKKRKGPAKPKSGKKRRNSKTN